MYNLKKKYKPNSMFFIIKATDNTLKSTYFISLLPATIAYWIIPSFPKLNFTVFAIVTQYCSYFKNKNKITTMQNLKIERNVTKTNNK